VRSTRHLRQIGFHHYWAMSPKGYWVVKQKPAADRLRRTLRRIADWCQRYRYEPVPEQWTALRRKLLGALWIFRYHRNFRPPRNHRYRVIAVWRRWLSRSQRAQISWRKCSGCWRVIHCRRASRSPTSRSEAVYRRAGCGKSARPAPWEPRRSNPRLGPKVFGSFEPQFKRNASLRSA
jgi:hypothetical protein